MATLHIDDVHRMLDLVDGALKTLSATRGSEVEAGEIAGLCSVAAELADYRPTWGPIAGVLGIAPHLLSRYTTYRGPFQVADAAYVAQRIRSFLRSQDQAFRSPQLPLEEHPATPPPEPSQVTEAPVQPVAASEWRYVQQVGDLQRKVGTVSEILNEIIHTARGTNLPPDMRALTDIERAQLIAVLETALAVLRAPMAERSILKKAKGMLGGVTKRVAEKQAEQALGSAAGTAREWLTDLINSIWPRASDDTLPVTLKPIHASLPQQPGWWAFPVACRLVSVAAVPEPSGTA